MEAKTESGGTPVHGSSPMKSPKSLLRQLKDGSNSRIPASALDGIRSIRGSDLKERERLMAQMIEELKASNADLKSTVHNMLDSTTEAFEAEAVQEQVETLGDEKKKLERELRAVENRIKHIMAEHEEIESEMAGYESKAKKILDARAKKLEWEKTKEKELQVAEQMAEKKRRELAQKAAERDYLISQRRDIHTKHQEQAHMDVKEEKKVAESLREKISEYEKVLKEHKKLQSMNTVHPSKIDQIHRIKNEKKQKKEYLVSKAKLETQAVTELDKKLEKLRQIEQRMLEEKKASLSQKGLLKSHLQDIMNKKIQESEMAELLVSRDKQLKSPGGIRRKSLTRILQGEEIDKEPRTKSPGLPTKFVGGNIGSYTEMRKQTHEQRERTSPTHNDSALNHSHTQEKSNKPAIPTRFASPQTRLTQTRPATAVHTSKPSVIVSPKGPISPTKVQAVNGKVNPQPKLTKPAVSKPSVVTVAKPAPTKAAQKKEAQSKVLATTAQKTVMRGRGAKKETGEEATTEPKSEIKSSSQFHDTDVQIESSRYEDNETHGENNLSETQFGASTIELSKLPEELKDISQPQFEDHTSEKHLQGSESVNELESQKLSQKEISLTEAPQKEEAVVEEMQPKNLSNGLKETSLSSKAKAPSVVSTGSKTTTSQNKSSLKSPSSTVKSAITSKSGFTNKRV